MIALLLEEFSRSESDPRPAPERAGSQVNSSLLWRRRPGKVNNVLTILENDRQPRRSDGGELDRDRQRPSFAEARLGLVPAFDARSVVTRR